MNYDQLLTEIQNYVDDYFKNHHDPKYVYHNINHTENVVRAATEIANHFQLNEADFFVVSAASWFHDLGYMSDPGNHEEAGATIAAAYLQQKGLDEQLVNAVRQCILATKMPQAPGSLLEKIICDADLYHLGTDDFFHLSKLMRKEHELVAEDTTLDKEEWNLKTLQLLEKHHYQTEYCQLLLNATKNKNQKKLQEKIFKQQKERATEKEKQKQGAEKKEDHQTTEKDTSKFDRGVQTMFRVSAGNNQHLSRLADYKAHVMVSVNSIILSIVLGLILRRLEAVSYLAIPTYLILVVCLATIVFSVLAIRPSLPKQKFSLKDIEDKKINLLFFGNFYRMSMEDYIKEMERVMQDPDSIYATLIKDTYSEGVVLARKYRFIRISYDIFLYGIILSVVAFVVATILNA